MERKTLPGEYKPPVFGYEIQDKNGQNNLHVIFNKDRKSFEYDVIEIILGEARCYIVRDDLAHVIANGHRRTDDAIEESGNSEFS